MRITLIKARRAKELTQAQLGNMVNVSRQTIGAIERGRIEGPGRTWDALQDILGIDQRELRALTNISINRPEAQKL